MKMKHDVKLRPYIKEDGLNIFELVKKCPPLELNSRYFYTMIGWHFSQTSFVAEIARNPVGFIYGFASPMQENTLFIWQLAVLPEARRKGIGKSLLNLAYKMAKKMELRRLCCTIDSNNYGSRKLLKSFAQSYSIEIEATQRIPNPSDNNRKKYEDIYVLDLDDL